MKNTSKKIIATEFLILLAIIVLSIVPLPVMFLMNLIRSSQFNHTKNEITSLDKQINSYESKKRELEEEEDSLIDKNKLIDFYNYTTEIGYYMGNLNDIEIIMKTYHKRTNLYAHLKAENKLQEFNSFLEFSEYYGFRSEQYDNWWKKHNSSISEIKNIQLQKKNTQNKLTEIQKQKYDKNDIILTVTNFLLIFLFLVYPLRGIVMATIWAFNVLRG